MQKLKEKFRRVAGYDENHTCGDCRYFQEIPKEYKRKPRSDVKHYYCTLMGYNGVRENEAFIDDYSCINWRVK